LKIPEALSQRKGVSSSPVLSDTADTISGSRGTKTKETEKPRSPIPARVVPRLLKKLKYKRYYAGKCITSEGPSKNMAIETIKKAERVTYLLAIFAQRNPTIGDAKA
jgi:hypothetical protein